MKCNYGCGQEGNYLFKNGKRCCSDHYTRCPTYRKFNSERHTEQWKSLEFRRKVSRTDKQKAIISKKIASIWSDPNSIYNKDEFRLKKANAVKKTYKGKELRKSIKKRLIKEWKDPNSKRRSQERKDRASLSMKKIWKDQEKRKKLSDTHKRRWTEELRNQQSIRVKNLYKDENFLRKRKEALNQKPNKQELRLMKLLEKEFPGEYIFVGDGELWIDGKNPDFINKSGNKIIELFGRYWHGYKMTGKTTQENEKERIAHFKKENYKTLIIWDIDLKDANLSERIINFHYE